MRAKLFPIALFEELHRALSGSEVREEDYNHKAWKVYDGLGEKIRVALLVPNREGVYHSSELQVWDSHKACDNADKPRFIVSVAAGPFSTGKWERHVGYELIEKVIFSTGYDLASDGCGLESIDMMVLDTVLSVMRSMQPSTTVHPLTYWESYLNPDKKYDSRTGSS